MKHYYDLQLAETMTKKLKTPKHTQGKHLVPTLNNPQGDNVTFVASDPTPTRPKPSEEDVIVGFFHCGLCKDELPEGMSLQEFHLYDIGWTEIGIQVWCRRHNKNIIHIDFEGYKHPAV